MSAPAVSLRDTAKDAMGRGRRLGVLSSWRLERFGGQWRLAGEVAYHDEHPAGSEIVTSELRWIDFGLGMAETRNTLYMLGKHGA